MLRMKRIVVVFGSLFLGLIVSCGGSGGGGDDAPITPPVNAEPTPSPDPVDPTPSPDPTPTPADPDVSPTPSPVAAAWNMIWADEFSGDTVDASNWGYEVNCFGGGNNEQQCYTDRSVNSYVADGSLHIVAREEVFSGPNAFDDDPNYDPNDTSATRPFTSARLRTKDLFEFTYGRIEFRAQVPGGQGMWPALWMLPTDYAYGGWPRSGEIDVFESVNLDTDWPNEVHGTLHYGLPWPQWQPLGDSYGNDSIDFTGEFHTYAVEWEADEIRWYVDDVHYQTQTSEGWYNYIWLSQEEGFGVASPRAPFDKDFHIIMNVAVGGDWPGAPDTGWTEDREMLVDYVRVYQCNQGNEDGTGCKGVVPVDDTIETNADNGAPIVNEFDAFVDAPATFTFNANGADIDNTLQIQSYQAADGNVIIDTPDLGGERGTVLDVTFSGVGNIFLASADMSAVSGVESAFSLSGGTGWSQNGQISFDLYVESIDAGTRLLVKLDSGYPNLGSVEIATPTLGEWTSVSVSIADLLSNPLDGGSGVDLSSVVNLFVLEPTGGDSVARVMLDNIKISCAVSAHPETWQQDQVCGVDPAINLIAPPGQANIFVDTVSDWGIGVFGGGVTVEVIEDDDADRGNIIRLTHTNDESLVYLQSAAPMDFSAYAGGTLEFDMMVEAEPAAAEWFMKTETFPQGTGDTPLTESVEGVFPTVGVWQHYTFNLDDLVSRQGSTLDLSNLQTPLVVFPTWGNQSGAIFRLDNVIMTEASD